MASVSAGGYDLEVDSSDGFFRSFRGNVAHADSHFDELAKLEP